MPLPSVYPFLGFTEPFSSLTHLLGAVIALLLAPSLIRRGESRHDRAAIGVFVFGIVFLLSMSGVYHLLEYGTDERAVLRRLDHAAIWVLIAASFTPIHMIAFRGFLRWGMLGLVWTGAVTGLILETVFFSSVPPGLGLGLYLGLGWLGVVSGVALARRHGAGAATGLMAGGIVYSIGGAVSIVGVPAPVTGVLGHHEIFHIACLAAMALHWRFIGGVADRGAPAPSLWTPALVPVPIPVESRAAVTRR